MVAVHHARGQQLPQMCGLWGLTILCAAVTGLSAATSKSIHALHNGLHPGAGERQLQEPFVVVRCGACCHAGGASGLQSGFQAGSEDVVLPSKSGSVLRHAVGPIGIRYMFLCQGIKKMTGVSGTPGGYYMACHI